MGWLQSQTRVFRTLLYLYPAEFRHEYGAEMERLFASRLSGEPRFRLWLETITDIASNAPREHWDILLADLRYGARVLLASPGFTLTALLVIALSIGATIAIFSLVNAVVLRLLPYGHTEQLMYLWSPNPRFEGVPSELGPNVPDFYDWQRVSRSFSSMTMLRSITVNLLGSGPAERVEAAAVTGNFFSTLQSSPELGRTINASDDQPGHQHVAMISDSLWRSHFASDASVLGKPIRLNREQYTVIGVMPPEFGYPFEGDIPYGESGFRQTDIWLPAAHTLAQRTNRSNFDSATAAIGRLRPGVTAATAERELLVLENRLGNLYPAMWRGWTAQVRSMVQTIIGPVEQMMWLLLGAVFVVLLIGISNVANLLFARATVRAHEMGIRTALGAERARIVRQLLTESLLLSCTGGAMGVGLAYAAVRLLIRMNPGEIPRFDTVSVDGRVLFVAVTLSIVTGLAAGLAPTLALSRININALLKRGGSWGGTGSANRGRFVLIVAEVALSIVLLAAAGLLIRSYLQLQAVDTGFSPATLTFGIHLDERYNTPEQRTGFARKFLERLQAIRGVTAAGASNSIPLSGNESVTKVDIQGSGTTKEMLGQRDVTVEYRKALGTPLLLGRDFRALDVGSKLPVVIVNRKFSDIYFKGRDPLGQHVRLGMEDVTNKPWSTVVGVIADIRHIKLEDAGQPEIFQVVESGEKFALQCTAPVPLVIGQARNDLRALDPALSLEDVKTMSDRARQSSARRRFQTILLTGFGALAIFLALVGLYGLMAYAVKERTAEIGLRMALGSSRARIVGQIMVQGLRLTSAGLLIGLTAAFLLTRLVSAWLFGVNATDPITFIAVPLFVFFVSGCACFIPAWNATLIDPVQALRRE